MVSSRRQRVGELRQACYESIRGDCHTRSRNEKHEVHTQQQTWSDKTQDPPLERGDGAVPELLIHRECVGHGAREMMCLP